MRFMAWLDRVSLPAVIVAVVFLGLAPLVPEPHVWEKLKMLYAGTLSRPIDIFDLILHGAPWAILVLKLWRSVPHRPA